jgi:catechol 2,3-dioxygenase-like lactoylglutathione lyase family enzyme
MHLQQVSLVTRDLARCRSFYGDKLGFAINQASASEICFQTGCSKLHFREDKNSNPRYHFAFSVANNQLQNALTWIGEKATILPYAKDSTIADFINWNAKAFYFRDHDQNILECITHFDKNSLQDGPFTKDGFERLVEIGIPVDDVETACADFYRQYNIPYFSKGPHLKDFAVMGDDNGMLIITKTGRGWLPTQEPAGKCPLKIILNAGKREILLELN